MWSVNGENGDLETTTWLLLQHHCDPTIKNRERLLPCDPYYNFLSSQRLRVLVHCCTVRDYVKRGEYEEAKKMTIKSAIDFVRGGHDIYATKGNPKVKKKVQKLLSARTLDDCFGVQWPIQSGQLLLSIIQIKNEKIRRSFLELFQRLWWCGEASREAKKGAACSRIFCASMGNSLTFTPLHVAAQMGYNHEARILLSMGADPNIIDTADHERFQYTPLMLACGARGFSQENSPELEKCCSTKELATNVHRGRKEMFQCFADVAKLLLEHKADICKFDKNRNNALHWVIRTGRKCTLEAIIEREVDLRDCDTPNIFGNRPIHYAVEHAHASSQRMWMLKAILSVSNPHGRNKNGHTPSELVCHSPFQKAPEVREILGRWRGFAQYLPTETELNLANPLRAFDKSSADTDDAPLCFLCHSPIYGLSGRLDYKYSVMNRKPRVFSFHKACIVWTPEVKWQNGAIIGIEKLLKRSIKSMNGLRCYVCRKPRAMIACRDEDGSGKIQRTFHYPCAVNHGCKLIHDDEHSWHYLFCPHHDNEDLLEETFDYLLSSSEDEEDHLRFVLENRELVKGFKMKRKRKKSKKPRARCGCPLCPETFHRGTNHTQAFKHFQECLFKAQPEMKSVFNFLRDALSVRSITWRVLKRIHDDDRDLISLSDYWTNYRSDKKIGPWSNLKRQVQSVVSNNMILLQGLKGEMPDLNEKPDLSDISDDGSSSPVNSLSDDDNDPQGARKVAGDFSNRRPLKRISSTSSKSDVRNSLATSKALNVLPTKKPSHGSSWRNAIVLNDDDDPISFVSQLKTPGAIPSTTQGSSATSTNRKRSLGSFEQSNLQKNQNPHKKIKSGKVETVMEVINLIDEDDDEEEVEDKFCKLYSTKVEAGDPIRKVSSDSNALQNTGKASASDYTAMAVEASTTPSDEQNAIDKPQSVQKDHGKSEPKTEPASPGPKIVCEKKEDSEVARVGIKNSVSSVLSSNAEANSSLDRKEKGTQQPVPRIIMDDISCGKEPIPIRVVNTVDSETIPGNFTYITKNDLHPDLPDLSCPGCSCEGDCHKNLNCECRQRYMDKKFLFDNNCALPDVNVNEVEFMYECHEGCSCSSKCGNRVTTKLKHKLEVYRTRFKGWALRTLEDIEQGSFVLEYIGKVFDPRSAGEHDYCYLFKAGEDLEIDPKQKGNAARFMNHSCTPNLRGIQSIQTKRDERHGYHRIVFFANQNIPKNQELTICYGYPKQREPNVCLPCRCYSPGCHQTLF